MTRDTILQSEKNTRKCNTQESQEVSPFQIGARDHKAARNRQDSITKTNMKHINNIITQPLYTWQWNIFCYLHRLETGTWQSDIHVTLLI